MKIAEIIAARTPEWKQLAADVEACRDRQIRKDPARLAQFAKRYRAVCGDLSLAMSMRFPIATTEYLHQLVANAHTQLYRSESFRIKRWWRTILIEVPRRILHDPCTWISFVVFWGLFVGTLVAGLITDDFASSIVGDKTLLQMESMYSHPMENAENDNGRALMTGFYLFHNAGIGLQCFASGIFLGVGSLITLAFNAMVLGTIFGHMFKSAAGGNFITFVTAHGPFELTAVVLSGAAGLRLGWAVIDTGGKSRRESLRETSPKALEVAGVATVLFLFAAYIEGFISPSSLPYSFKVGVAVVSTAILLGYVVVLGGLPFWSRSRAT